MISLFNRLSIIIIIYIGGASFSPSMSLANDIVDQAVYYVQSNYYDQNIVHNVFQAELINKCRQNTSDYKEAINCTLTDLNDPYTKLLPREEAQTEESTISNSLEHGFGVVLDPLDNTRILSVLPGSPADLSNIEAGDQILVINDLPIKYISKQEIHYLLEPPIKSSDISLHLKRNFYFYDANMTADKVDMPSLKVRSLENNILYIQPYNLLSQSLIKELKEILSSQKANASEGLVIDLRDNVGGLLTNGLKVADLFLPEGDVICILQNKLHETIEFRSQANRIYNKPIAILINSQTSSSAEIISAALYDNSKALLIGSDTYGKGSIQKIEPFVEQSSLHITVSQFLSPRSVPISNNGVHPHIEETDFEMQLKLAQQYILNHE